MATVLALAASIAADAGPLNLLSDAPIGHFNDEDMRLLRESALSLLLHEDVGATREWHNPQSTASGKIEITKAFESTDGFKCKVLRMENSAAGWHGRATHAVCEIHPGDWKIHADARPAAEIPESPDNKAN